MRGRQSPTRVSGRSEWSVVTGRHLDFAWTASSMTANPNVTEA